MSELTIKYPTPENMLLPDVPHRAMWWRLMMLSSPDGHHYITHFDNVDYPTQVTITWHDEGRSEAVTPYAVRISHDTDEAPDLGRYPVTVAWFLYTRVWLDVLTVEPPTSNPRWEALTRPGSHRHPDDLEEIERTGETGGW